MEYKSLKVRPDSAIAQSGLLPSESEEYQPGLWVPMISVQIWKFHTLLCRRFLGVIWQRVPSFMSVLRMKYDNYLEDVVRHLVLRGAG